MQVVVEKKDVPVVTKTVGVNYWDVKNDVQAGEGEVTVAADANNVNTSTLTDIPEGYELVSTGDVEINDGWIWVEVKPVATTQEVGVNYWDIVNNTQAGEGKVTVAADANNVNTSALTDIPEGYELTVSGDITINDGWIWVEVKPVATTQEIGVNYWDVENDVQAGEGKVTVAADAYNVNTSVLTDIPEGYELASTGDIKINDGWIYVEVRPAAEKTVEIGVNYWDVENNKQAGEGKVTVDAGANNVNTSALTDVPEGYELVNVGDVTINDGWIYVEVKPVKAESTIIHVTFKSEGGKDLGGGDYFVDADGDGVFNYSELTLPEGYELIETGDTFVDTDKTYEITLHKTNPGTIINVVYVDENGNNLGGGDYFVDMDDDGIANFSELDVPEGYKLVVTGDFFVADYTGQTNEIKVEKIQKGTIINVVFEDRQGNNLGGGDYLVDEDGDGVANYSELDLPAGYKLIETGDFFVKDAADGMTVVLDRDGSAIIHVVFKSEGGKNLGGGDYFVDEDGDGVFNYSELDLPVGYELIVTGDEFVDTDKTYEITLHKINAGTIINVVFVDEEGNNLGGGDYFVDMDDDGIANFSELDVPEGYKLVVTGDFFVADYTGQTNEIKVEKIQKGTIINVVFEDRQGNNLGGGDYLVDEDGDGVANYSELDLPAGYKLIETGDFFVKDAADGMTVVLDRDGSAIIHVVFKSEGGKNLGGGDYFVDEDGDGVFNYSELDLPVGYELIVTGDEFVDTDKTYEITLHKINAGTIINVVFVDEEGNNLGGGDYFVDMDDDGIANFSELTLPEGYELIVTGDFFVDEYVGHSNTIVLKKIEVIRDASLRVTFETTDGKKVWATKMMTKEGVEGEDVVFSLGEDFHLPLFFKLAEGVDQITDITIPAGSVGGHTMIVEPIFDVRLPKLQLHLKQ